MRLITGGEAMAVTEAPQTEQSAARASLPHSRHQPAVKTAVVVTGAGMAFIVGRDGSPVWQLTRVAVVATLTLVVLWGTSRLGRAGPPDQPASAWLEYLAQPLCAARRDRPCL